MCRLRSPFLDRRRRSVGVPPGDSYTSRALPARLQSRRYKVSTITWYVRFVSSSRRRVEHNLPRIARSCSLPLRRIDLRLYDSPPLDSSQPPTVMPAYYRVFVIDSFVGKRGSSESEWTTMRCASSEDGKLARVRAVSASLDPWLSASAGAR
ncbi:hypothetical protein BD311DRAFT_140057 [Dichomitus squalens]|uniref:Uncharacterized protein n=1 Tax=Dichomitus squalens TaxID=114155 RepID=A0A4Q9M9F6_9APHY|nr:hypothetical protein BD311DRAFT_140057 [Dichomitus squalens]